MAEQLRELSEIPGLDTRPQVDPDSASALDDLIKKAEDNGGTLPDDEPAAPAPEAKDEPKPDPAPAPEPEAKDEPKPDPAPAPEPKPDPAPAPEKDELDEVALPPYTKPKTTESFDKVKQLAREKITGLQKERDALQKERDELKAKVGGPLPAEVEAELKELREFRGKLDVDADPAFASYNTQIEDNNQTIYSRMLADGFTKEQLDKVKEIGVENVDWESLKDRMKPGLLSMIFNKIGENESIRDKRDKAIAEAKKNVNQYLEVRRSELSGSKDKAVKLVEHGISDLVPKLGWMELRRAKTDATPEEKAKVDAHNKLVEDGQQFLTEAKADDSPQMRAILAVGYVQLLKARADIETLQAEKKAEVEKLTKELEEAKSLIARIKKSSTTRLRESPETSSDTQAKLSSPETPGAEALDAHAAAFQR